jgi:1-acyl-sn-glycerol-3-phosphate acyltransferase
VIRVGRGPLFPDDGPRAARLRRRARGIAIEAGAFAALTLLAPLVFPAATAVDLVRRRHWTAVRLAAMGWWFLFVELRGLAGLAAAYAGTGGPFGRGSLRRRARVYQLRIRWARGHVAGLRALFGVRFEVEGLDDAGPGPELVFIRHASVADGALPDAFIGHAHGLGLRFVIKRELQALPTMDIGGRWVPTLFVRRESADSAAEIASVRRLVQGLGDDEAVLIYPEGTRYTAAKRARAQAQIAERRPDLAPLAGRLRHVLPPRLGGTLALLEASPDTDVVIFGHVGLEGLVRLRDVWSGGLIGTTVRMRFWRHAASTIPAGERERAEWLYARWGELDQWVGEQLDAMRQH